MQVSHLSVKRAAELNFDGRLWIPEDLHSEVGRDLELGGSDVADDDAVLLVWQRDADVIQVNCVRWKQPRARTQQVKHIIIHVIIIFISSLQ